MKFSDRVNKYYESKQVYEILKEESPAIYLLFGLCNYITGNDTVRQGRQILEDLKNGKLHEIPDYNVKEVTKLENYIRTGKLKYDMTELAKDGIEIGELLYMAFKEIWHKTTKDLYEDIDNNTKTLIELILLINTAMRQADASIFEENFFKLMKRFDLKETEEKYQEEKEEHCVTMEWLEEKQENVIKDALEMDIMHYADKPSSQYLERVDYQYHKSMLSCEFEDNPDYMKAYAKIMKYASRKDNLIIFDYKKYGKYIALNFYRFRPEQQKALFEIVKKLDLIHDDMVIIKPELGKYLGIKDDGLGALENTIYYAPYLHIKKMLQEEWFINLRRSPKYNEQWADAFAEGLMRSKYGWQIANEWRERRNQVKGYVIGCLKEAGIIKDDASNDFIAREADIMKNTRTFGKYIGKESREQPYAEWIMNHADDFL